MNKKLLTLSLIATLTVILTGCYHTGSAKPSPTPTVQSTGDSTKDLQEIDKELEQDTDLPDLTNTDLGL